MFAHMLGMSICILNAFVAGPSTSIVFDIGTSPMKFKPRLLINVTLECIDEERDHIHVL